MDKYLLECWFCHKPDNELDSAYCTNCGKPLRNHCVIGECIMNAGSEPIYLDPTDCYCPECGHETKFYRDGLIEPIVFDVPKG